MMMAEDISLLKAMEINIDYFFLEVDFEVDNKNLVNTIKGREIPINIGVWCVNRWRRRGSFSENLGFHMIREREHYGGA